ncbi:hypothetical protein ScPMuIL_014365 [Solemya velum]
MIGKTVRDFVHPTDHKELEKHFIIQQQDKSKAYKGRQSPEPMEMDVDPDDILNQEHKRVFYLKMKFHMMKKGTKTRHSGNTLVQWSGRLKLRPSSKAQGYSIDGLLCICRPMQTNSILEIRMDGNMFMSRHELDMRFTFCDPRIITLIGYEPGELIGKTAYQFHNPLDAKKVSNCHSSLIVKGTSVSKYYRFLGKSGDWVWMQTRATIIYNTSNSPQYVVCMNYVISEEEGQRYLMMETEQSDLQLPNIRGSIELNGCDRMVSACDAYCGASDHVSDHSDGGYGSSYSPYSSSSHHSNPSPVSTETKEVQCSTMDINRPDTVCQAIPDATDLNCLSNTDCLLDTLEVPSDFPTSTGTVKIEVAKEDQETLDEILGTFSQQGQITTQADTVVTNIPTTFSSAQDNNDNCKQNNNTSSLLRRLLNPKDDTITTQLSHPLAKATASPIFSMSTNTITNTVNGTSLDLDAAGANMEMKLHNTVFGGNQRLGSDPLMSSIVPFTQSFVQTSVPDTQNVLTDQTGEFTLTDNSTKHVVPPISSALPDDLVDLAMNFCDSLADEQAQAVMMADMDQDVWMGDIGDFSVDHVTGLDKNSFVYCNMASDQQINLLFPDHVDIPTSFSQNGHQFLSNSPGQTVITDCSFGNTVNSNGSDCPQIPSRLTQNIFTFGQSKYQNSCASSCSSSPTSTNTRSSFNLSPDDNLNSANSSASRSPPLSGNSLQDQSMTELEKHLRGYVQSPMTLGTKQNNDNMYQALNHFRLGDRNDMNDSKPVLQKLLTGELSKDKYHAMERQRTMRDRVTPINEQH